MVVCNARANVVECTLIKQTIQKGGQKWIDIREQMSL